ncbi:MAG: UbiA family prenyltransferase [Pseudomonadota bacterium]
MNASPSSIPLVVDVDGTLVRGDLLHEATLQLLATNPLQAWRIIPWLARGKAALKEELSARIDPGLDLVPLRQEVLDRVEEARQEGRPVVLASASPRRWIEPLAQRIGGADVMASDESTNLAGEAKRSALVKRFGEGGFDYIGDSPADIPVWSSARRKLVIGNGRGIENKVDGAMAIVQDRPSSKHYLRALRPHQWAKNLLLFLPLVAGHEFFDPKAILASLIAFIAFSVVASSAYIINDLLDLPSDRDHPEKCNRPFATGAVSPLRGIGMSICLIGIGVLISLLLPQPFTAVLGIYLALTLGYSFVLKRQVMIDIIALGGLYTIRVFAGVVALEQTQSTWLFMFSLFLFLSLAAIKRCTELVARREAGKANPPGRGYRIEDIHALFPLAAAAGYGAVLVVALYLSSPDIMVLYSYPERMWLICPILLYWVSRIIVIASRNELHHDPLIFALTDKVSWMVVGLAGLVILVAI